MEGQKDLVSSRQPFPNALPSAPVVRASLKAAPGVKLHREKTHTQTLGLAYSESLVSSGPSKSRPTAQGCTQVGAAWAWRFRGFGTSVQIPFLQPPGRKGHGSGIQQEETM